MTAAYIIDNSDPNLLALVCTYEVLVVPMVPMTDELYHMHFCKLRHKSSSKLTSLAQQGNLSNLSLPGVFAEDLPQQTKKAYPGFRI
jgi:hypothetical protein